MYTILICDDDKDIVSALDIYLTSEGYRTVKAYDGLEALKEAEHHTVDLILMDIMMPGLDGIRTTAKLREKYNVPIILLTAKSEDADKVLGLNIGADDYITKPFNPIEVIARVKSQLRRYTSLGGKSGGGENTKLLTNGGIALDDSAKSVTVDEIGRASFPPARSMSWCGTTPLWARKTRWRYTSGTCGKRSRSTRPTPDTSKWCGAWVIKWKSSDPTRR